MNAAGGDTVCTLDAGRTGVKKVLPGSMLSAPCHKGGGSFEVGLYGSNTLINLSGLEYDGEEPLSDSCGDTRWLSSLEGDKGCIRPLDLKVGQLEATSITI